MDQRPEAEAYQDAFARIERHVDAGDTDLSKLGFWYLVRKVKVEPALAVHWADECGRIDRKAFEARIPLRFPVWLGNALLLLGTVALASVVPVSLAIARGRGPVDEPNALLAGILAVVAAGGLSVTTHDLAHWVVGRLVGIRFIAYFLDGPLRIQPGLKSDYETYLKASPGGRAVMHASGAVASKIAPFAVFLAVYLPHRAAGYALFPSWSVWTILAIGVVQILTDAIWSTKTSDWKRVRRELRVAAAQRHR